MANIMAETRVASPNGRAEQDDGTVANPSASQPRVLPSKKPKSKLRAWIERQRIGVKLWLYRHAILAGLAFAGLNVVDAYLTNYAHRMATAVGVQQSIEANPFLQSLAGNWALGFKGVIGIAALGVLVKVRHLTPDTLFKWLLFGCGVFVVIILWNLLSLGVIG
jgi:hypothetical protein